MKTAEDLATARRLVRSGSTLVDFCYYCGSAFRPGFRGKSPEERAFNNVGFRCARDVD